MAKKDKRARKLLMAVMASKKCHPDEAARLIQSIRRTLDTLGESEIYTVGLMNVAKVVAVCKLGVHPKFIKWIN